MARQVIVSARSFGIETCLAPLTRAPPMPARRHGRPRPPLPAADTAGGDDLLDELERLGKPHENGAITDGESRASRPGCLGENGTCRAPRVR